MVHGNFGDILVFFLQKKTEYTDVQFSPDSGLEIRGNTSSTVQYSVVGDTTNMEYSVVGPKTASSQVSQIVISSESKSEIILKE